MDPGCSQISCGLPGLKDGQSSPPFLAAPFLALHRMGFAKLLCRRRTASPYLTISPLPTAMYVAVFGVFQLSTPPEAGGGIFSVALSLGYPQSPLGTILPVDARTLPLRSYGAVTRLPLPFIIASFANLSANLFFLSEYIVLQNDQRCV